MRYELSWDRREWRLAGNTHTLCSVSLSGEAGCKLLYFVYFTSTLPWMHERCRTEANTPSARRPATPRRIITVVTETVDDNTINDDDDIELT